jgi:hypothetical protein
MSKFGGMARKISISSGGSPLRVSRGADFNELKRQMREADLAKKGTKLLTKSEKRAARAIAEARERIRADAEQSAARKGVKENPMRELERKERERKDAQRFQRGTSLARVKRHGNKEEEEEDLEKMEEMELDRSAAEARLGIASPLPRSILHPTKPSKKRDTDVDHEHPIVEPFK